VENAVKHGMDPELEPLYISIATENTDLGVKITVEDTGPGYAPSDVDEPNYALKNIRERLKAMCGGTLEIEEREAGGTRVTIFIPQDEGK
jgi:LytS/YehU family sensor histidine kinase